MRTRTATEQRAKRTLMTCAAITGAALVSAGLLTGPAHAVEPTAPSVVPAASAYVWGWSDGAGGTRRTFPQSVYGTAANLPRLVVQGSCASGARVGDRIKLQWRDYTGRYRTEDTHFVGNCNGAYSFEFYPYAPSGAWARGTYKYRLIVPGGGGYKYFEITYTKR